jgi:hypothetical protein
VLATQALEHPDDFLMEKEEALVLAGRWDAI